MPIDYKEYHPKWKLIRRLIMKRANDCCEGTPRFPYCRRENHSVKVTKTKYFRSTTRIILTIAHLDHDKKNNRFNNLKALCQRCHLDYDLGRHIDNRKYGRKHRGSHQRKLFFT